MTAPDHDKPRSAARSFAAAARNFQDAAEQLAAASVEEARRAAAFLNEAAARLRREARRADRDAADAAERPRAADGSSEGDRERRRAERGYRDDGEQRGYRPPQRSRSLCLNPARRRIVGVCAGIADYFGVEPWVTRCAALTGLIFMPSVTFPAYWVAFFAMGRPSASGGARSGAGECDNEPAALAAEPAAPRRRLRALPARFAELEARLRRMEAHVTSGQYELQRELRNIEEG